MPTKDTIIFGYKIKQTLHPRIQTEGVVIHQFSMLVCA